MHITVRPLLLLIFIIAPALFTSGVLFYVGEISDGVRLGFLSLIGCSIFYFAVKWQSKILYSITIIWWLIFWINSLLQTLSWLLFDSDPTAYFIIQAIANTSFSESVEFFQIHTTTILFCIFTLFVLGSAYFFGLFRYIKYQDFVTIWQSRSSRYIVIFFCICIFASYVMRPSRVLFPIIYWSNYYDKVQDFQHSIQQHQNLHKKWYKTAQSQIVLDTNSAPKQVHVLILSESVTSLNFGVCGYPRNTTPDLEKYQHEFKIFCNAYSPYSSTINALKTNLTNSSVLHPAIAPSESLLSDAKAAGFRVYWISNQDDSYISSLFGTLADKAIYHNKRSGRSSYALDEELLPYYRQALKDPYPKKLIILHFIGAHPNYSNRYPAKFEQFDEDSDDRVEKDLEQRDIGLWVQLKRNEYDNAILYQDWLIQQFFQPLKQNPILGYRSFTYVSDHGNEVGHDIDYAGHSPKTKAGYQVPVIMWNDHIQTTGVDSSTIIDTAELDKNLMHLMQIHNKTDTKQIFWLDSKYQFLPNTAYPYWKTNTH